MNKTNFSTIGISVLCLIALTLAVAHADYQIDWHTIDGGCGQSTGA